jgi:hypothetical protein
MQPLSFSCTMIAHTGSSGRGGNIVQPRISSRCVSAVINESVHDMADQASTAYIREGQLCELKDSSAQQLKYSLRQIFTCHIALMHSGAIPLSCTMVVYSQCLPTGRQVTTVSSCCIDAWAVTQQRIIMLVIQPQGNAASTNVYAYSSSCHAIYYILSTNYLSQLV